MRPIILLLNAILTVLLSSCGDKADTCDRNTAAYFTVATKVWDTYFVCDTIYGSSLDTMRFIAINEADSYAWTKNGSGVGGLREANLVGWGDNETIALTVTKNCLGSPATKSKTPYEWPGPVISFQGAVPTIVDAKYPPVYGTFRGSLASASGQSFYITILDSLYVDPVRNSVNRKFFYIGIPYRDSDTRPYPNFTSTPPIRPLTLRAIGNPLAFKLRCNGYTGNLPKLPQMNMFARINRSNINQITIEYSYQDTLTGVWRDEVFTGIRQ